MKKLFCLLLALATLCSVLAGCSGTPPTTSTVLPPYHVTYTLEEAKQYLNTNSLNGYRSLAVTIDEVKTPGDAEVDEYIGDLLRNSVTYGESLPNEIIRPDDVVSLYWIAYREDGSEISDFSNIKRFYNHKGYVSDSTLVIYPNDDSSEGKVTTLEPTLEPVVGEVIYVTDPTKPIVSNGPSKGQRGSSTSNDYDLALYTVGTSDDYLSDNQKAVKNALKEVLVGKSPEAHALTLKTKDYTVMSDFGIEDAFVFFTYKKVTDGVAGPSGNAYADTAKLLDAVTNEYVNLSDLEIAVQEILLGMTNANSFYTGQTVSVKTGEDIAYEITLNAVAVKPTDTIAVTLPLTFEKHGETVTEEVTVSVFPYQTQHCTLPVFSADFILNEPVYFVTETTGEEQVIAEYRASVLEQLTQNAEETRRERLHTALWEELFKEAQVDKWPEEDVNAYAERKWNNLLAEHDFCLGMVRDGNALALYISGQIDYMTYSKVSSFPDVESFRERYPTPEHFILHSLQIQYDRMDKVLPEDKIAEAKTLLREEAKQYVMERLILCYIAHTEGIFFTEESSEAALRKTVEETNARNLKEALSLVKKTNARAKECYLYDLERYKSAAQAPNASEQDKQLYANFLQQYPSWESYTTTLEKEYTPHSVDEIKEALTQNSQTLVEYYTQNHLREQVLDYLAKTAHVTETDAVEDEG